ncbi:hypothetical protein H696_01218 [Fonticula alba]|uniref:Uncharacterized protein n=1 Tax=Fonticula alba TaxID=691883 RepID=A0A058ZBJ8_FONAL|nr:hypothetical protein H696_01218 [Fonticula alba]KCV71800.1 hypothetical protein H696_01218 [Fonticula alba]|eukprot:XP_009493378.1 hypothetical protein H696_01218 [Fonticula alba]
MLETRSDNPDNYGPCCRCSVLGDCPTGYSACGHSSKECACCLQDRSCQLQGTPDDGELPPTIPDDWDLRILWRCHRGPL